MGIEVLNRILMATGLVASLACVTGCSQLFGPQSKIVADTSEANVNDGSPESAGAPLALKVLEDANDGTTLHVLASVVARTDWDASNAIVRLASLKEGEVETSTTSPVVQVSEGVRTILAEGEERRLMLSVPAGNATDYQIELLWGADAAPFRTATTQPLPSAISASEGRESPRAMADMAAAQAEAPLKPQVDLRGVAIARQGRICPVAPCAAAFKISGELHNKGKTPISEITLGVGFIRVSSATRIDLSKELLENESPVEITGLKLMPGASRAFNLDVDPPIAGLLPKELQPAVRVIGAR